LASHDITANEGDAVGLSAVGSTDPGNADTLVFLWQVAADNGQVIPDGHDIDFVFTPDDNGLYTVTLRVTDGDGGEDTATIVVEAVNVSPVITPIADFNIDEASPVQLTAIFDDAGSADTHTLAWAATASNGQIIPAGTTGTFNFTPVDDGLYTVELTVTDDDGGQAVHTVMITADNVAPVLNVSGSQTIAVGGVLTLAGLVADVSSDTPQVRVDFGDGIRLPVATGHGQSQSQHSTGIAGRVLLRQRYGRVGQFIHRCTR